MPVPQGRVPLTYSPGPWVALAGPGDVLMLAALDPAGPAVTACWEAMTEGAGVDGLLGVILREGLRNVPSFALAERTGDTVRVLVSGDARAEGGGQVVSGAEAPPAAAWVDRTLPASGVDLYAGATAPAGPILPSLGGIVFASRLTLHASAEQTAEAAHTAEAAQTAETAQAADTDEELAQVASSDTIEPPHVQPPAPASIEDSGLIEALPFRVPSSFTSGPPGAPTMPPTTPPTGTDSDLAQAHTIAAPPVRPPESSEQHPEEPAEEPSGEPVGQPAQPSAGLPSAPTVLAVSCPNGHLGPPYSGQCRVCGAPIPPQEPYNVPRPTLGILNMSTGDMVPLDRDVVLGRSPTSDESDPQVRPHLVQLASPGNDISRNHVRVSLEGWHVQVVDLDSTNGTVITAPGQPPVRLRAHDPFTIVPGTLINIADEVNVRYEVQT